MPNAHIRPGSPRAKQWLDVFGTTCVPIKGLFPHRGVFAGVTREFYDVAVDRLSDDQVERAARFVAEKFGEPLEQARQALHREHGLPLLAEDVTVSVDARLFY